MVGWIDTPGGWDESLCMSVCLSVWKQAATHKQITWHLPTPFPGAICVVVCLVGLSLNVCVSVQKEERETETETEREIRPSTALAPCPFPGPFPCPLPCPHAGPLTEIHLPQYPAWTRQRTEN